MPERPNAMSRQRWKALEPILDAALEREPSERTAFLNEACGGDAAIRAEVERLLAACDGGEALFSTPAAAVFAPLMYDPLPEVLGGKYRIVRELGRGGMATVYLAEDPKHARQVAVKVLHEAVARRVGRQRFLREIGIAARLSHSNILPVHDSGEAESESSGREGTSYLYYVSPYVAGESLRERLRRVGKLPVSEAVRFAREAAEALAYAHRQGVIHRDIKPGNILLLEGHAIVADFGIARAISSAGDEVTGTDSPVVLGTPAYMSPEQSSGSRQLDARTDIYSLGCVLYEMLTGERPGASVPIDDVALPDIAAVVRRAMAPNASDRFSTANELAQALTDVSLGGRAGSPRRWWPAAALLAIVVSLGLTWSFWPNSAPLERSIVVLPIANITPDSANEYFTDGLTEEIITRLAALPQLKVISRTSAMHYKGSDAPLRRIASELNVAHVLEGSVRQSGGQLRVTVQLIDARSDGHLWAAAFDFQSRDLFGVQERIARDVVEALKLEPGAQADRVLARRGTSDSLALDLYQRGRFFWAQRTAKAHERAIEFFQQAIARDSNYADAYAGLALALHTAFQTDLSPAREPEVYSRVRWATERALALDDHSAAAHAAAAALHWYQHNWPGAEREYRRALELNPGDASVRGLYAVLLTAMGRIEEARRESSRAVELDPFSLIINVIAAHACYDARAYDCTIELHTRALELNDAWVPSYVGRALAYSQSGNHDAAIRDLSKAVELAPRWSYALANMAYGMARAGRVTEAREFLRRAKVDTSRADGERATFPIGRAHVALGEADSAFVWFERSAWQWQHRADRADPSLDPVRSDPRFVRLSMRVDREMGLR